MLRQIDLRIQIRHAELAAPAAARRHLDDAEGRPLLGKENRVARFRVLDIGAARQRLAAKRHRDELERLLRFAAAFDDAIHAQFLERVGLGDLPTA